MLRRRPLLRAAAGTALVAGTATAVSGRVRRRQQRRWNQQDEAAYYEQQQYAEPAPPPPPAAGPAASPPPAMSSVEQLTQLADLHDRGVLSDDEFTSQKAKILAM